MPDLKISEFIPSTSMPSAARIPFADAGQNYYINGDDFRASLGTGYSQTFSIAGWASAAPNYQIIILGTTHKVTNPQVIVEELVVTNYVAVGATYIINPINNDITIQVPSVDLRFDGRVVIK